MLKSSLQGAKRRSNLLNIVYKILQLSKFTKVLLFMNFVFVILNLFQNLLKIPNLSPRTKGHYVNGFGGHGKRAPNIINY